MLFAQVKKLEMNLIIIQKLLQIKLFKKWLLGLKESQEKKENLLNTTLILNLQEIIPRKHGRKN